MRRKIFLMLAICVSAFVFSTAALAQQKFTASLNGPQEVPPINSPGRGSCVITLNTTETQFTVTCTYSGLTTNVVGAHIHDAGPVGVSGPVRFNFNYTGTTSGTIGPLTFPATGQLTPAQVADLRAKRWYVNIHTTQFTGGEIRGQVKIASTVFDLDGDGRTDITAFRQSANTFFVLNSVNSNITANQFGSGAGDFWLNNTGDFDGDGRGDPLLIKLVNNEAFHSILQSGSNTVRTVQWGNFSAAINDSLAYGDYDGDAKQDIAVFRRSTGVWYILESSTNTGRVVQNFGAVNDFPSVGDYDADGRTDLCVVRAEGGQRVWYIQNSSNGQSRRVEFGASATDGVFFFSPVDVDGDGRQDILVNRTINGQRVFFVLQSSNNQVFVLTWGLSTDTALFGDYDGDGRTDFVARRNIGGLLVWYIYQSSNQQGRAVTFGQTGDQRFVEPFLPVSSDEVLEILD
jgi:hypothetical protein